MTLLASKVNNQIGIKEFGREVDIKDFYYIQLKYYLNCVNVVFGNIPYKFQNYQDYKNGDKIYIDELETMYKMLNICTPQKMENLLYFIEVENGSKILDGLNNNFIEITNQRDIFVLGFNSSQATILASRKSSSIKIMFFKSTWSNKFYYVPIKKLKCIIDNYYNKSN
jgi:hypothetical protein